MGSNQTEFADNNFWEEEYSKKDKGMLWDNSIYANKKIHQLLDKSLPKGKHYKLLEVGCYPGSKLIYLNKKFGYSIYGVELIKKSALKTEENLKKFGIKGKVINSDFFDSRFLKKYDSYFDIILDFGFSEHFENFDQVIKSYSKILKPKGYLVIIIPNLQGAYKRFISESMLKKHNLKIMDFPVFEKSISKRFKKLEGSYVGGVYSDSSKESNISLLIGNKFVRKFLINLFKVLNKVMICFNPPESKTFSPYLMYIGIKK